MAKEKRKLNGQENKQLKWTFNKILKSTFVIVLPFINVFTRIRVFFFNCAVGVPPYKEFRIPLPYFVVTLLFFFFFFNFILFLNFT